jgi:uncharacterized damage-inducible protein DinB
MNPTQENGRQLLMRMWKEAWEGGLWAAPWKDALEGLTPEQAALRQGPGRRSIWEIAAHVCFWREHELRKLAGEKVPGDEIEARNYERPMDVNEGDWRDVRRRFEETHHQIAAAMADEKNDLSRIQYLIPHDNYHVGQIMTLRAMLGLPPIN